MALTTRQKIALGIVLNRIALSTDIVPQLVTKIIEKYNLVTGVSYDNDSDCAKELLTLDDSIRLNFIGDIINLVHKLPFRHYLKVGLILLKNNIVLNESYIVYNMISNIIHDCSGFRDREVEISYYSQKTIIKFTDKFEGDFYELSIKPLNGETIIEMGWIYSQFYFQQNASKWFEHSMFEDLLDSLSNDEKELIPTIKTETFDYHYNHLDKLHVIICKPILITNHLI